MCHLAGHEIILGDNGIPQNLPNARERAKIVSCNPAAAAEYFHYTIDAVIKNLLREGHPEGGVLGHVRGYYGILEEQGRGW